HLSLAVGTYTASGNSLLAVGMPCAFYSQHMGEMVGRDAMCLDGAVRECQADVSKDDDDMDDDASNLSNPQSSEPCGPPRDSQIMPLKKMSQAAIAKLVANEVAKALAANHATRITTGTRGSGNEEGAGYAGGPERA
nr:hypothetical protein [Tanacetum cinerariifolium]